MSLLRDDVDHLALLLPEPFPDALKQGGLAGSAVPERGEIAIGIFVVIIQVNEHRGTVIEVQAKENAFLVAQFKGGKGKCRGDTGSQSIAAAFPLNIGIGDQQR